MLEASLRKVEQAGRLGIDLDSPRVSGAAVDRAEQAVLAIARVLAFETPDLANSGLGYGIESVFPLRRRA